MSVPHGVVAKSPSTIRENPKSHTYIDGGKDADMLASGIPCREAKQGCLASTYLDGTVIVLRREQNVLWLSTAKHTHVTSMKGGQPTQCSVASPTLRSRCMTPRSWQ